MSLIIASVFPRPITPPAVSGGGAEPIVNLRLGDTSGTTAVDSKGVRNGTYVGTVDLGLPTMVTGITAGVGVKGGGGHVAVPQNAAFAIAAPFSVSLTFQIARALAADGDRYGLLNKSGISVSGMSVEIIRAAGNHLLRAYTKTAAGVARWIPVDTGSAGIGSALVVGTTYRVTVVQATTGAALYLGATQLATNDVTTGLANNTLPWGVGCFLNSSGGVDIPLAGCIGDFRFYNVALSQADIAALPAVQDTIWLRDIAGITFDEGSGRSVALAPHAYPETGITAVADDNDPGGVVTHAAPSGSNIVLNTTNITVATAATVTAHVTKGPLTSREATIGLTVNAVGTGGGGSIPTNPLNTHSPIVQRAGTFESEFRPAGRSDGVCYDYGLANRNPAPARVWSNNCGWSGGTVKRPPLDDATSSAGWNKNGTVIATPVRLENHPGAAVVGGLHSGRNPYIRAGDVRLNTDVYCNSRAISLVNGSQGSSVFGVHIRRAWDGISGGHSDRTVKGVNWFTIEHSWIRECCDDMIEADGMQGYTIRNCLMEGSFDGLSGDGGGSTNHYPSDVIILEDCLIELGNQVIKTYREVGSCGVNVFKTDANSAGLSLKRCVFAFGSQASGSCGFQRHAVYFGPNASKPLVSSVGPHWVLYTSANTFDTSAANWWTRCGTNQQWFIDRGFNFLAGQAARDKWAQLRNQWIADHWYIPRFNDEADPPPIYNIGTFA